MEDHYLFGGGQIPRTDEQQLRWDETKRNLKLWGKNNKGEEADSIQRDFLILENEDNRSWLKEKENNRILDIFEGHSNMFSFFADEDNKTTSNLSIKNASLQLHSDVLNFVNFISIRDFELNQRKSLIENIEELILSVWPEASVVVHGSLSTGLMIPTSDIDIVLFNVPCDIEEGLNTIAKLIEEAGIISSIEVIAKTRVPLVKFVSIDGIPGDICIDQESGLHTARIVQESIEEYPFIRPLVLVLKYFLTQRHLNETYTGGIGSFLLTLMVVTHCQRYVQHLVKEKTPHDGKISMNSFNLGSLLVSFFEFYGKDFNFMRVGISVLDNGTFFPKVSRKWIDSSRPYMLSLENPHENNMDVGKGAHKIIACRNAFKWAYQRLVAGLRNRNSSGSDEDITSLITLIIPNDDFLKSRFELLKLNQNNNSQIAMFPYIKDKEMKEINIERGERKRKRKRRTKEELESAQEIRRVEFFAKNPEQVIIVDKSIPFHLINLPSPKKKQKVPKIKEDEKIEDEKKEGETEGKKKKKKKKKKVQENEGNEQIEGEGEEKQKPKKKSKAQREEMLERYALLKEAKLDRKLRIKLGKMKTKRNNKLFKLKMKMNSENNNNNNNDTNNNNSNNNNNANNNNNNNDNNNNNNNDNNNNNNNNNITPSNKKKRKREEDVIILDGNVKEETSSVKKKKKRNEVERESPRTKEDKEYLTINKNINKNKTINNNNNRVVEVEDNIIGAKNNNKKKRRIQPINISNNNNNNRSNNTGVIDLT